MFNIRRNQLQKLGSAQTGQLIGSLFEDLGFDDLLEHSVGAELLEAFNLTFNQYTQAVIPPPGGVMVPAFDALRLAEGLCDTGKSLYTAVANSREELLKENLVFSQEATNGKGEEDLRLQEV